MSFEKCPSRVAFDSGSILRGFRPIPTVEVSRVLQLGVLGVVLLILLVVALGLFLTLHILISRYYMQHIVRIFQEKPLFIIPHGKLDPAAEDIELPGATASASSMPRCYGEDEPA